MPNCSLFSGFVPCYPPSYFLCTLITHTCSLSFYSSELKPAVESKQQQQSALDSRLSKKLSVLGTDGNMIRCKFEQSSPLPGTPRICLHWQRTAPHGFFSGTNVCSRLVGFVKLEPCSELRDEVMYRCHLGHFLAQRGVCTHTSMHRHCLLSIAAQYVTRTNSKCTV